MSRDVAWALGVVMLVALGTSVVATRMSRAESPAAVSPGLRPTRGPYALIRREWPRFLKDEKGREYCLDDRTLSIAGIRLGMTVEQVRARLGPEQSRTREDRPALEVACAPYHVTVCSYPERQMTVCFAGGEVLEVTGATIESDGWVMAQESEPRETVNARLRNVMVETLWTSPVNTNLRYGSVEWDSFETTWSRIRLPGGPVPGFALRRLPCGHASSSDPLTHPVNYATLVTRRRPPVKS